MALVESLHWELAHGFTVITGETGAGKSIILGALKLLLGERADKTLIRTGAEQCSVEAEFEVDDVTRLDPILVEQGIDPCEESSLLLRRIVSANGLGRQFVNGVQTTLSVLRSLGDQLVDLHGPHDHQSLLSREAQLQLVDAFAQNEPLLERFRALFTSLRNDERKLAELNADLSDQQVALLQHQLNEIQTADPHPGELEELTARYKVAANARRIGEIVTGVLMALTEDENSIRSGLAGINRLMNELGRLDESTSALMGSLRIAGVELEDLERGLREYQQKIDLDPASLLRTEERLNLLQSLERKYRRNEAGLVALGAELNERLGQTANREMLVDELQQRIEKQEKDVRRLAGDLSAVRRKVARKLSAQVLDHLTELGFRQCAFEIAMMTSNPIGMSGSDQIEFLFAPNPGEPLKPLRAIASSGEISRVMLALKTVLAQEDLVGLLVFDEIDANVGGEIANAVGAKMKALGRSRQVLAITHLPQVAAQAVKHYRVTKEIESGRTRTALSEVTGRQRIEELARMLGGQSDSAIQHAEALLGT